MEILKRIVSAFRPGGGPTGICPQCDVEDPPSPDEPFLAWLQELGHTEEEAREICQETGDLARMMLFGLPPREHRIEGPSGSETN